MYQTARCNSKKIVIFNIFIIFIFIFFSLHVRYGQLPKRWYLYVGYSYCSKHHLPSMSSTSRTCLHDLTLHSGDAKCSDQDSLSAHWVLRSVLLLCLVTWTESLWQVRDVAQRWDRRIANEGVVCYVRSESAGWKAFISVDVRHTKKSTAKFTYAASNLPPSPSNEQQKATLMMSWYKCRAVY